MHTAEYEDTAHPRWGNIPGMGSIKAMEIEKKQSNTIKAK